MEGRERRTGSKQQGSWATRTTRQLRTPGITPIPRFLVSTLVEAVGRALEQDDPALTLRDPFGSSLFWNHEARLTRQAPLGSLAIHRLRVSLRYLESIQDTVCYKMKFAGHWRVLRTLSVIGVVGLTMLSVVLLEEHRRRSFVVLIHLLIPPIVHIACCLIVFIGVQIMRLNDSLLGSTSSFQRTWFLRAMALLGILLSGFALAQLLDLESGYIPFTFSSGTGFLWVSFYHLQKLKSEQAGDGDATQRPC